MVRLVLVVAFALFVAACARFPGAPPNEDGVLSYDWIPADPRPAPPPLYCYMTLGRPECYATPVPGRELVGHFGAAPSLAAPPQANAGPMPAAMVRPMPAPEIPPPAIPLEPVQRAPQPLVLPPAPPKGTAKP